MYRSLSAALAVLLLAGCSDQPTAPAAPHPEAPAPARVLGMVEVTFEAAGTPRMSASARWLGAAPGGAVGGGGLSFDLTPVGAGSNSGIQLASAGRGFVDVGSTRYLYASFQVRNAATNGTAYTVARKNVTFVAYTGASTFAQTAVNSLARFDGTAFSNTTLRDQIARDILPTHGMTSTGAAPKVVSELADFQALPESDLTALPTTNGHPLAYGYVVRCVSSCADGRTLAASPAAGEYDGRVTFAVRMPLQATATDNPFRFSMIFLAVEDGATRVTEALEEQGTGSAPTRAAELPGSTIEILGTGSVTAGGYSVERLCRVRTAGTDPANPLATLVDAGGCTPGAVAIPANVRVVDAAAAPDGDGRSWATAFDKLQDALTCVRGGGTFGCGGVTEIWVAGGVYYPDEGIGATNDDVNATFSLIPGVSLYGGFAGTELSRGQRDWIANPTILSGDVDRNDPNADGNSVLERPVSTGSNARSLITANGATPITASTVVDGFTLTAVHYSNGVGAAFLCSADGAGSECSPTLRNLNFSGNNGVCGGGLNVTSDNGGRAAPRVESTTFFHNTASAGGGACVLPGTTGTAAPAFVHVTFVGNVSSVGGAVYMNGRADATPPSFHDAIFRENGGSTGKGGAVYISGGAPAITNAVFWDNDVLGGSGGAIYLTSYAAPVLTNVTFAMNSAGDGGAIAATATPTPTLTNAILWGDTGGEFTNSGGSVAFVSSVIQGGCPAAIGVTCTAVLDQDPHFVDVGGGDLRLQNSSPAVDAGLTGALPSDLADLDDDGNTSEAIPLDLDGRARVADWKGSGAIVDMGAYELQ